MFFLLLSLAAIAAAVPASILPTESGVAYFTYAGKTFILYVDSCVSSTGNSHPCIKTTPYSSFGTGSLPTFCLSWYNGNPMPSLKQNNPTYNQGYIGSFSEYFGQGQVLVSLDADYQLVYNYIGSVMTIDASYCLQYDGHGITVDSYTKNMCIKDLTIVNVQNC